MRKTTKKQTTLLMIAFVMVFTLILNVIPAHAATTKLSTTKANIAINGTKTIKLKNKDKKAEYTYMSNDKKIATVNKKGVITGVSAGETTVKVTQVLDKKQTTLGTVNVIVKKASINKNGDFVKNWTVISQSGLYENSENRDAFYTKECVKYYNPKAVYKYYSSDSKKLKVATDGTIKEANGTGTVKIEVKETYNKKTTTVGSFEVKIKKPTLNTNKHSLTVGEYIYSYDFLDNCFRHQVLISDSKKQPTTSDFNSSKYKTKSKVLKEIELDWWGPDGEEDAYVELEAVKKGTAYLHYAVYDYKKEKYTDYLGYITVTVKEKEKVYSKVSNLTFPWEEGEYSDYSKKDGLLLDNDGTDGSIYITQTPKKYSGEYTIENSNPELVEVYIQDKYDEYYEDRIELRYEGNLEGKTGTATITIKGEGVEKSFKITVRSIW